MPRSLATLGLALTATVACAGSLPQPRPDLPEDFQQLLPRGAIAAVDAPRFVSAAEADIDPPGLGAGSRDRRPGPCLQPQPPQPPRSGQRHGGRAFAVPHREFEGGETYSAGDQKLWLYRPRDAEIFYSTRAFYSPAGGAFVEDEGGWIHLPSGARFERERRAFTPAEDGPVPLEGFDTFWFNWSMTRPQTEILRVDQEVEGAE